jgi:acyl transferase domain-containing protein/acyl carrier protein
VLSSGRPAEYPCIIGSVKTNMGHTEAAAGVAGLIKATLCLKNRQIPPHLNFQEANPKINFEQLGLRLAEKRLDWPQRPGPAYAAVNSFGFGGTNAHVILQEAPKEGMRVCVPLARDEGEGRKKEEKSGTPDLIPHPSSLIPYLIPLSARHSEALRNLAEAYLEKQTGPDLASLPDLSYSASQGRNHHNHRLAIVARSQGELADKLRAFLKGQLLAGVSAGQVKPVEAEQVGPRLTFVFSGMGPQWWGMGRQLLEQEPVFRQVITECDAILKGLGGWSLLEEMQANEENSRLTETEFAQPASFALQVALAALWRAWGIEPDAAVGHSIGEVAAAHVAGILSLEEGLRVIYHMGRLQQSCNGRGSMLSVGLSLTETRRLVAGYGELVEIAAINDPANLTLAGDTSALEEIAKILTEKQIFCQFLKVKVPYHSQYLNELEEALREALAGLNPQPAQNIRLYSTVTGKEIKGPEMDTDYWWRNVRYPVLFARTIDRLGQDGGEIFLEIGAHPALTGAIRSCLNQQQREATVLSSLHRRHPDRTMLLGAVGTLYSLGYPVNWSKLYPARAVGRFVKLPTYPWQHGQHWPEHYLNQSNQPSHPLLGQPLKRPQPTWENELNPRALRYLEDHRIHGSVVYPGAAYVEMGAAAGQNSYGALPRLENVKFHKALFLAEGETPRLQLVLNKAEKTSFEIFSSAGLRIEPDWNLCASGQLNYQPGAGAGPGRDFSLTQTRQRCPQEFDREFCYQQFRRLGLEYGPLFQGIYRLWQGQQEALAEVRLPAGLLETGHLENYHWHPAVLDLCFQALAAAIPVDPDRAPTVFLPVGVERIDLAPYRPTENRLWIYVKLHEQTKKGLKGDVFLMDETGQPLVALQGYQAVSLEGQSGEKPQKFYEFKWIEQEAGSRQLSAASTTASGQWLVFSHTAASRQPPAASFESSLISNLEEQAAQPVVIEMGEEYQVVEVGRRYAVNPARLADFQQLLDDVTASRALPCRGIIYLWGLEEEQGETSEPTAAELEEAQLKGCGGLLHLVQALAQVSWRKDTRLWIVTRGTQPIGPAPISLTQMPLWGMGRVLGHQEHVEFWGGMVDLDPVSPRTPEEIAGEARTVFEEIWHRDREDEFAYRNGQRYIARMVENTAHKISAPPPYQCRADGAYLITGGLGGLGLLTARWLIEQGARRLILMSRSTLPPRATWSKLTADDPAFKRVKAMRELEAMGASVHLAAVDVADESQLTAWLAEYRAEGWPPIRGVVHSAGVAWPQLLTQINMDILRSVMRPKLVGGWLLHQHLSDQPLDFFVMYSSIASVVATAGQGNYAAANAFLDGLAHYRQAKGLPGLSINWGPWADIGMAEEMDLLEYFAQRGLFTISTAQGAQVFSTLWPSQLPQVTVVAANWRLVADWSPMGLVPPTIRDLADETSGTGGASQGDGARQPVTVLQQFYGLDDQQARLELLQNYIQSLVAKVLRMNPAELPLDQPLNSLGLDSMVALELKNHIENGLELEISVVDLLSGVSVSQLADKIRLALPNREPAGETQGEAELDELMAAAEQLSDEDLQKLLAEIEVAERQEV